MTEAVRKKLEKVSTASDDGHCQEFAKAVGDYQPSLQKPLTFNYACQSSDDDKKKNLGQPSPKRQKR